MTDQSSNSNSNIINRLKIDGIEMRLARFEDLKQINDLLIRVSFDAGVHILELCYLNSNRRWLVVVDKNSGEIVGFDSSHVLPVNGVVFAFDTYIAKEYQNRGISRAIGRDYYESVPFMGNSTAEAVFYISLLSKFDMKLVGFSGKPGLSRLEDGDRSDSRNSGYASDHSQKFAPFEISILESQKDMEQMLAYDRSVLDLDRMQFMRAWCTKSESDQPYAKTLVAKRESDGDVVGFGTLRLFTDYYVISPLYADDQVVAKRLLIEMVKILEKDCGPQELYVFFDAKNHMLMEFVQRLKFRQCDCEIRHYEKGAEVIKEHINFEKVYALHDYWPV